MKKTRVAWTKWGEIEYFEEDIFIGRSLAEYGWYSLGEIEFLTSALDSSRVVIEVGANIGALTLPIARTAGNVLAFEPQPENFFLLQSNIHRNKLDDRVHCRHTAVGAGRGLTTVPYLSQLPIDNFGGVRIDQGTYPVAIESLDDVCRDLSMPRCDLIKIDVEGYEQEVILGALEVIQRFRPCLYFENDRVENSASLLGLVRSLEYRMYPHQPRLDHGANRNIWDPQSYASINVLAIPKENPSQIEGLEIG